MGFLASIANGFKAIAAVFGWAKQRDAEENTPEMQANAAAKTDAKIADQATKDIATGDINQIRKDAAQ